LSEDQTSISVIGMGYSTIPVKIAEYYRKTKSSPYAFNNIAYIELGTRLIRRKNNETNKQRDHRLFEL
jgi:hypothetical protein